MFKKKIIGCLLILLCSCQETVKPAKIIVIAHRGDMQAFPENSIGGIKNCIKMGVDMVEIDLAMTKDSVLVIMHDQTLDRTTNGTGQVNQWTFDSLQQLRLRDKNGILTQEKIPTFKDVLLLATQNDAQLLVDKSYNLIPEALKLITETNSQKHAIFLVFKSGTDLKKEYPIASKELKFCPLLTGKENIAGYIDTYTEVQTPYFLYSFKTVEETLFKTISLVKSDAFVMATTQNDKYCAGYSDLVSLNNPEEGWGWLIRQGFNAICTDYPKELLAYLSEANLH